METWLTVTTVSIILITHWILYFRRKVSHNDRATIEWNNVEWKIEGLVRPAYWVRFINAGAFGSNHSNSYFSILRFFLYLIKHYMVEPALQKSLQLMHEADQQGIVPKILCNQQARQQMQRRSENYYIDLYETSSLSIVGKLLNYIQSSIAFKNHYGLLQLGMNPLVQQELVNTKHNPIVFIASFPRTGTTILHRTMAKDTSRYKCFDMCDMVCPLPTPIPRWDLEGRKQKAAELQHMLDQEFSVVYPGFFTLIATMHEFTPNEADENLTWYDAAYGQRYLDLFMKLYPMYRGLSDPNSTTSPQRYPTGTSPDLESTAAASYRYAWLKMILQIYQYNDIKVWNERYNTHTTTTGDDETTNHPFIPCPTTKLSWLLKDPDISAYLPQLHHELGPHSCKYIHSHRDPCDLIISTTKVFQIFCVMDAVPGTPGTSGKEWGIENNNRLKRYCQGIIDFHKKNHNNESDNDDNDTDTDDETCRPYQFQYTRNGDINTTQQEKCRVDFHFLDVVTNIPGAIETIYRHFYPQELLSHDIKQKFITYLNENQREKYGNQQHRTLKQLSLTKDEVTHQEYNRIFLEPFPEHSNSNNQ